MKVKSSSFMILLRPNILFSHERSHSTVLMSSLLTLFDNVFTHFIWSVSNPLKLILHS